MLGISFGTVKDFLFAGIPERIRDCSIDRLQMYLREAGVRGRLSANSNELRLKPVQWRNIEAAEFGMTDKYSDLRWESSKIEAITPAFQRRLAQEWLGADDLQEQGFGDADITWLQEKAKSVTLKSEIIGEGPTAYTRRTVRGWGPDADEALWDGIPLQSRADLENGAAGRMEQFKRIYTPPLVSSGFPPSIKAIISYDAADPDKWFVSDRNNPDQMEDMGFERPSSAPLWKYLIDHRKPQSNAWYIAHILFAAHQWEQASKCGDHENAMLHFGETVRLHTEIQIILKSKSAPQSRPRGSSEVPRAGRTKGPETKFADAVLAEANKLTANATLQKAAFTAAAKAYPHGNLPISPASLRDTLTRTDQINLKKVPPSSNSWRRWLGKLQAIAESCRKLDR